MVAADLELDRKELESMLASASRPNVKAILKKQISVVKNQIQSLPQVIKSDAQPIVEDVTDKENKAPSMNDITIDNDDGTSTAIAESAVKFQNLKWTEVTVYEMKKGKGFNDEKVVIDLRLKGVENLPEDSIQCDFTRMSCDLKVVGLEGNNYRFRRTALQHDIVATESKWTRKKNHVLIEMQKVKSGAMGYETWSDIGGRRKNEDTKKTQDPSQGLMSMMKDMYDEGDESTRKIIGEAMAKCNKPGGPDSKDLESYGVDENFGA